MKVYKVCRVLWLDTSLRSGWHSADELDTIVGDPDYEVHSVGWLIESNDKCVILAMSTSKYKAAELLTIPRDCVVDMWTEKDEQ